MLRYEIPTLASAHGEAAAIDAGGIYVVSAFKFIDKSRHLGSGAVKVMLYGYEQEVVPVSDICPAGYI